MKKLLIKILLKLIGEPVVCNLRYNGDNYNQIVMFGIIGEPIKCGDAVKIVDNIIYKATTEE